MENTKRGFVFQVIIIAIGVVIIAGLVYLIFWSPSRNSGVSSPAVSTHATEGAGNVTAPAENPMPSASVPTLSTTQSVKNTVVAALNADRDITNEQDLQSVLQQYYTQSTIQKVQTAISSGQQTFAMFVVDGIPKLMPDPSSLDFNVVVGGDFATATTQFSTTSVVATGIGEPAATTTLETVTISLQNENNQWKMDSVGISTLPLSEASQ